MKEFFGDVYHVFWLFGNFIICLFMMNFEKAIDSLFWIKIHFTVEHKCISSGIPEVKHILISIFGFMF